MGYFLVVIVFLEILAVIAWVTMLVREKLYPKTEEKTILEPVSSAVELLVYTETVGGSIPSPATKKGRQQ